jgi:hypothetical protein
MPLVWMAVASLAVASLSAALAWVHVEAWRRVRAAPLADLERRFFARQFSRRIQVSMLLFVVGAGLFAGGLISPVRQPTLFVGFWFVLAVLLLWIVLLALVDVFASSVRHSRLYQEQVIARAKLEAEVRRKRDAQRAGKQDPEK